MSNKKNEQQRQETLESYKVLDSSPEAEFDKLTKLAAYICGTPIAAISLIDKDRQWFKSIIGLQGLTEIARKSSICTHAIAEKKEFIVSDALLDDRFKSNSYVTSGPKIRFYAASPLMTPDGNVIGTLCVMDNTPRELTSEQIEALNTLSCQVIDLLELRKANLQLAEQQQILVNKARLQTIGELAGGVCHQINNPLAIIVGRSMILRSQLKQKLSEDKEVLKELDVIDQTSHRISGILKALRMYAKDFGNEVTVNSVNEIVDDAMTLIKGKLTAEKVNLHYQRGEDVRAMMNKNQISQVVLDVLNNAVEAMEETSSKELTVEIQNDEKNILLVVTDTGKGVRDEESDKIFDPFFSTKARHFGVGLSNARNFMNQHKGRIQLLKKKNPTQFIVTIPKSA